MQRISPKRALTFGIGDFSRADQDVLRAAYAADLPMSYIGFRKEKPYVMAIGHPGAIAMPDAVPEGSMPYSLKRIKGIEKSPEFAEPGALLEKLLKR